MSAPTQPVVIQLTPPGRGAVATLRIEGPGAVAAVQAVFRARGGRPLGEYPPDRIVVGRIGAGDGRADEEVVVCRRGGDAVELHCHGGLAAVAAIEEGLAAAGCRTIAWRQWADGQSSDPIAAAAIVALAEACTQRTAAILLDQYHGALRRAIAEIQKAIDAGDAERAQGQTKTLLSRSALGRHLTRPWSVVLAGRSNVGKSSLMNALVGHRRAIVHATPGTTRDAVTARTAIDGWPVELCDTAGLRTTDDPVEQAGIERAQCRLAAADLAVLICDVSAPWSAEDQSLWDGICQRAETSDASLPQLRRSSAGLTPPPDTACQQAATRPAILVHNKCDLPIAAAPRPAGLLTSALRGDGIEELWAAIARQLVPDPHPPGAAVPFTPEQVEMIRRLAGD
jgi:tRNA modification GTPase